jgi:Ni,Fe-hydrogenase III small subunit/formate hydrogenlyase subunit 6/NADH:ubiquinone oxidoreductase subunit I
MMKLLLARFEQGRRTVAYPASPPNLPDRFRGGPRLEPRRCTDGCRACVEVCPTDALRFEEGGLALDMGRCLFCSECVDACPTRAITLTQEYRLAARRRDDLVVRDQVEPLAKELDGKLRRLFGRSLKLRQVSAGGCNGCEADVNVLGTIVFDLARFGIQMVASPRHADGLLITGPVTENMKLAVQKTYDAVPAPKIVIAVGACAISGGPYFDHPEVCNGAASVVPVDLYIPGCPPHPFTILDGLLGMLGRLQEKGAWAARVKAAAELVGEEIMEEQRISVRRHAEHAVKYLGADLGRGPSEEDEDAPPARER